MSFLLHHELVGATPSEHTALVLHGALGSGQNFRGFIKKLSQRRPDYTFVLCDLRGHGDSHPAPAPHTMASCSADLLGLVEHLEEMQPGLAPTSVLIGHSLGGKVALHFGQHGGRQLRQIWALDSNPGPQEAGDAHEIRRVMSAVRAVRTPIEARADVVAQLREQGLSNGLAQWMTTNLRRQGDRYEWALDLPAIEELLRDYFEHDLWPFVEAKKAAPEVHLVVASLSDRWNDGMRERGRALPAASRTFVHELPDAGHWVHVDNPEGLLELMAPRLA